MGPNITNAQCNIIFSPYLEFETFAGNAFPAPSISG